MMTEPLSSSEEHNLAVVSSYFNPYGSSLMARNILITRASVEARNVPFFVAEAVFPGQAPFRPAGTRTLLLNAQDLLWHKERLLNLLIRRLPDHYDHVAWIDADVLFPDGSWSGQVSSLLQDHALVQLFDQALILDAAGRAQSRCRGVAYNMHRGMPDALELGVGEGRSHPGLAWAARRDFLAEHGLFDQMVVGGGDTMLVAAAYGAWDHWHVRILPEELRQAWHRWARPVHDALDGDVGYVPTSVLHLWHGDTNQRQYVARLGILSKHRFDPATDLRAENGLWEWSSGKDEMHADVADYFLGRESAGIIS